jgi:hypothetical protein
VVPIIEPRKGLNNQKEEWYEQKNPKQNMEKFPRLFGLWRGPEVCETRARSAQEQKLVLIVLEYFPSQDFLYCGLSRGAAFDKNAFAFLLDCTVADQD